VAGRLWDLGAAGLLGFTVSVGGACEPAGKTAGIYGWRLGCGQDCGQDWPVAGGRLGCWDLRLAAASLLGPGKGNQGLGLDLVSVVYCCRP
jgi:hypothetical protein